MQRFPVLWQWKSCNDCDVKVGGGTLQVKVDYKGTKLAGTESTEAKILSFTFDKSVEANAVVFSEPIVNEEDGTIVFRF